MFLTIKKQRFLSALIAVTLLAGTASNCAAQGNWFFKLFSLKSDYIVPSITNQLTNKNSKTLSVRSNANRTKNQLKHFACATLFSTGAIGLAKCVLPSIKSHTMQTTLQLGIAALCYLTFAATIRGVRSLFVKYQDDQKDMETPNNKIELEKDVSNDQPTNQ